MLRAALDDAVAGAEAHAIRECLERLEGGSRQAIALALRAVLETEGPVAVRYPRGREGAYRSAPEKDCIRTGGDLRSRRAG